MRGPATQSLQSLQAVAAAVARIDANLSALSIDPDRSVTYSGNMKRLRAILRERCFPAASKATHHESNRLHIVVFGGSMTDGSMNCMAQKNVLCTAKYKPTHLTWRSKLIHLLQTGLPGCKIHLRSSLFPASRSDVLLASPLLVRSSDDVVIEDFTVNDQRGTTVVKGRINNTKLLTSTIAGHEVLALSARSQNASLLLMESFPAFGWPPQCVPFDDHVHRTISRTYAVPIISFMRAICTPGELEMRSHEPVRRHWVAGCGAFDEAGTDCEPHPGPHTHQVYAWLLARYLLHQAMLAFTNVMPTIDEPSQPLPSATFLDPNQLEALRGCAPSLIKSSINARVSCGEPLPARGSWYCYEDKPGKRGWIAEGHHSHAGIPGGPGVAMEPQDITFTMKGTRYGKLVVGYLRSYEGMAPASLFINGNVSAAVTLDAVWADRTSQTHFDVFPLQTIAAHVALSGSHHHPSRLTVTLRVPAIRRPGQPPLRGSGAQGRQEQVQGRKFKLTQLVSC